MYLGTQPPSVTALQMARIASGRIDARHTLPSRSSSAPPPSALCGRLAAARPGAATAASLCLVDEIRHHQPLRIRHALDHTEPLEAIGKGTQLGHERFIHAPLELDVVHRAARGG